MVYFSKIILLVSLFGHSLSAECPKPESLYPCKCDSNQISCDGLEFIDLKRIFSKLSLTLTDGQRHFEKFVLNNREIPELLEDTFGNITFEVIFIDHAYNLTRIETKTFSKMESKINHFIINKTPIENSVPKYDLFTALSSMNNLVNLDIEYTTLKEIPDNAFRPINGIQKSLKFVKLPNNEISRVGENAFQNLPNTKFIDLSSNKLQKISENSFKFLNNSEELIEIDMSTNELNGNSFAIKSFDNLKRPALLTLNYNNITYLEEKVFSSFLNNNTKNRIILSTLDCSDCRSVWLVKNHKFEAQLNELLCSDDSSIFNKTSFHKCLLF